MSSTTSTSIRNAVIESRGLPLARTQRVFETDAVSSRRRSVGLLFGVAAVGACTTVRLVQPAALLADNAPAVVWVTDTANTVVPVFNPVIRKDTLRGRLQGRQDRVKIPMSEIRSIEARVPAHARTALLAAAVGAAAVSALYVVSISQAGPGGMTVDCARDPVLKHPEEFPECGT